MIYYRVNLLHWLCIYFFIISNDFFLSSLSLIILLAFFSWLFSQHNIHSIPSQASTINLSIFLPSFFPFFFYRPLSLFFLLLASSFTTKGSWRWSHGWAQSSRLQASHGCMKSSRQTCAHLPPPATYIICILCQAHWPRTSHHITRGEMPLPAPTPCRQTSLSQAIVVLVLYMVFLVHLHLVFTYILFERI